jgi:hypothetical protein
MEPCYDHLNSITKLCAKFVAKIHPANSQSRQHHNKQLSKVSVIYPLLWMPVKSRRLGGDAALSQFHNLEQQGLPDTNAETADFEQGAAQTEDKQGRVHVAALKLSKNLWQSWLKMTYPDLAAVSIHHVDMHARACSS